MLIHITLRGELTLCSLPIAFVDEYVTFKQIVFHFRRSRVAFRRRGCKLCGDALRVALRDAVRIS
jgi:hypothetical protein